MKHKRHRQQKLTPPPCPPRHPPKCFGEGAGFEVEAEIGRDEVGETEEVEAAGEEAAGDAVEGGEDPGDLGLVDC